MATDRMTLDSYLSNFSKNRRIDGVVKKWFFTKNGARYCVKNKKEWDEIINSFFKETDNKN